jgi:hypothetical protein
MTTPTSSTPRGPGRAQHAARSAALLFAVLCVCVFAVVLAERFPLRADLTATREHRLSPRTLEVLRSVKDPLEVVVTANFAALDRRQLERTQDVLAVFSRETDKIKVTLIDSASAQGVGDLDAVLARLVERARPAIERHAAGVREAGVQAARLAAAAGALADELNKAQTPLVSSPEPIRRFLTDSVTMLRASARDLAAAAEASPAKVSATVGRSPVPALDEAGAAVRAPLAQLADQLSRIAAGLGALTNPDDAGLPPLVRDTLAPIATNVSPARDTAARAIAALDDLPRLPLITAARTLERTSTALVIGPPDAPRAGLTAMDLSTLFPPSTPGQDRGALDLRARAEELIAGAVASLSSTSTPLVVLVHGEPVRFSPEFTPLRGLAERLSLRGIDLAEWPAALDAEPPSPLKLDPTRARPIVWTVISTDASTPESAVRMGKLAAATRALINDGRNVLLSLNPSALPGIGQPDPMVDALPALGLSVDTGKVLLSAAAGPRGPVVSPETVITTPGTDHPVARALPGLPVRLPWALPVRVSDKPPAGVTAAPVLLSEKSDNRWLESEWARFRAVRADQREFVENPPTADSPRDETGGPWPLAAAGERAKDAATQRVVVVGSNAWFLDDVAMAGTIVDARPALISPGNLEFFESAVYFLSGQDRMIAASAVAAAVPVIPPMSASTLAALRWLLIAGLPLAILLIGAALRIARG